MHMHLFLLHIEEHAITAFYTFFFAGTAFYTIWFFGANKQYIHIANKFFLQEQKKFAHMSMKYSHFRLLLLFSLASSHCHPNHHLLH